jgi:hypothetical protein
VAPYLFFMNLFCLKIFGTAVTNVQKLFPLRKFNVSYNKLDRLCSKKMFLIILVVERREKPTQLDWSF